MQPSASNVQDALQTISPPHSLNRRNATQDLINRLIVQIQHGCGNPACSTPACASARSQLPSQPVRRYTSLSARALAVVLAASDDADTHICPHLRDWQSVTTSAEAQDKLDPKSVIQQLCNTRSMRDIQLSPPEEQPLKDGEKGSISRKLGKRPVGVTSNVSVPSYWTAGSLKPMTCTELVKIKRYLTSVKPLDKPATKETALRISLVRNRLLDVLSDFAYLSSSFFDYPTVIWPDPSARHPSFPIIRLDYIFRYWADIGQATIFDSLWTAVESIFESPFASRSQQPTKYLTLPPCDKSSQVAMVIFFAIHALTASVPRAQRETWHIIWSTIINGRAYGKQRYIPDDVNSSPWLHILDAFEYEPALRLAKRLTRAIGARVCLEETLFACGVSNSEDPDVKGWVVPPHRKVRKLVLAMLVREEQAVRTFKFKTVLRDENQHGKHLLGTTSLVWLEWLRKCFLKEWDGSYRVNRWSVAGSALEMMEELWKHRGKEYLDMPEDLFPTPVVFNHLDVDKAALDWISFKHDSNSRHLFSFQFLFSTRGSTLFFRTVNHILMRRAYGEAETVSQLRRRTMPRMSYDDALYLDRRMKASQDHYLVLKINRQSLLSDAFDQLWHREKRELLRPLRVRMGVDEGEIGHDLGGVQIEFFKLACQEAFNPDYSLFTIDPQTHLAWFQPASLVPLYKIQLFGLLFALAIFNGITLPVSFPMVFYRKLLFQPCDEYDLRDGWPSLTKSLRDLRNHEGSVEEDFARDYVFSFTANGLHLDVDMKDPWDGWSIWDKINSGKNLTAGRMKVMRTYPDKHHPDPSNVQNQSRAESPLDEPVLRQDEPTIQRAESASQQNDSASQQDESTSQQDESASQQDESASQQDESALQQDESASQKGTPTRQQDGSTVHEESNDAASAPFPKEFNWPGWSIETVDSTEEPTSVTNDNRKKYIEDYAKWVMDWSVRPQFMSFAKGFYAMMSPKALTLLNAETLRNLVEGQNYLDISALQRATTYQNYTTNSPVIRWFWEVVCEYPQEKQKQLLEFVTASNRVPINGAESLTFVIEKLEGDTLALPGSSTCFGTLRLPDYESKDVLKVKLDIALEHSLGFGQA